MQKDGGGKVLPVWGRVQWQVAGVAGISHEITIEERDYHHPPPKKEREEGMMSILCKKQQQSSLGFTCYLGGMKEGMKFCQWNAFSGM